jgi:hypothetical protein
MSIAVLLLPPTRHQVTERKRVTREPGLHRSRRHDARNRWHPTDFWIIIITGWLLRAALITQGLAGEAAGEFSVVDGRLSVDEQVADAGQGLMHDQFACWVNLASWSESHARRSTALLVDLPQHPQEASRMLDVNEAEVESILDGFKLLEDPRSTVNRSGRSARDSRCHSAGSSNPEGPPAAASAAKGLAIAGPETGDGARGASAVTWTRTGASGGPPPLNLADTKNAWLRSSVAQGNGAWQQVAKGCRADVRLPRDRSFFFCAASDAVHRFRRGSVFGSQRHDSTGGGQNGLPSGPTRSERGRSPERLRKNGTGSE